MGMKPRVTLRPRLRQWVVWLANTTDPKDDQPMKVRAYDANEAEIVAWRKLQREGKTLRFVIHHTYSIPEFREQFPGWQGLV